MTRPVTRLLRRIGLGRSAQIPRVDTLPVPAMVIDAEGEILAANGAATPIARALVFGGLANESRDIRAAARSERGLVLHAAFDDGDAAIECELTVVPLGEGRALVLARHGALDRNLREALVDSRRRYRDLVEISSDFAWEIDAQGAFVFVSSGGALGWMPEDLIGNRPETFLAFSGGAEPAEARQQPNPFRSHEPVHDAEVWLRRAGGGRACLTVSVQPLRDDHGAWAGARGVCCDVTEARERDALLARAHSREKLFGFINRAIRDEVDPSNMLAAAATAICRAVTAGGTEIFRIGADGPEPAAAHGAPAPLAPAACIGASLRAHGAVAVTDEGAQALAVATRHQGAANGVLYVWRGLELGPFTSDERETLVDAAEQLGIAIEQIAVHEQLKEMSATDGMTGLLNRRSFVGELARRFERGCRNGAPGALVYCDLDNVKQVNDTHGHDRGDAAIVETARLLRGSTGGRDLVARLGGGEFALWIEGADEPAARAKAEQLMRESAALAPYSGGADSPLGISLGIAVIAPQSGESLEGLMTRADMAMYRSKKRGKGLFTIAPPPKPAMRLVNRGR